MSSDLIGIGADVLVYGGEIILNAAKLIASRIL